MLNDVARFLRRKLLKTIKSLYPFSDDESLESAVSKLQQRFHVARNLPRNCDINSVSRDVKLSEIFRLWLQICALGLNL